MKANDWLIQKSFWDFSKAVEYFVFYYASEIACINILAIENANTESSYRNEHTVLAFVYKPIFIHSLFFWEHTRVWMCVRFYSAIRECMCVCACVVALFHDLTIFSQHRKYWKRKYSDAIRRLCDKNIINTWYGVYIVDIRLLKMLSHFLSLFNILSLSHNVLIALNHIYNIFVQLDFDGIRIIMFIFINVRTVKFSIICLKKICWFLQR